MQFEVEIRVKKMGTDADTLRSLRLLWDFDALPPWALAGEAYVVEETASQLSSHIRDELKGANANNLNETSGNPTHA